MILVIIRQRAQETQECKEWPKNGFKPTQDKLVELYGCNTLL